MKLTPLDIKKQEFGRTLRGYDPEEVQAFLSMVADEWEEAQAEQRRMVEKVNEFHAKLDHYEQVEEALQEALRTARENSKSKLENAEHKAELLLKEARSEARDLLQEAEQRRERLEAQIERLSERRDEVIVRMRAFLSAEMEMLSRFGGEHPLETNESSDDLPLEEGDGVAEGHIPDVPALDEDDQEAMEPWLQDEEEDEAPAEVDPLDEVPLQAAGDEETAGGEEAVATPPKDMTPQEEPSEEPVDDGQKQREALFEFFMEERAESSQGESGVSASSDRIEESPNADLGEKPPASEDAGEVDTESREEIERIRRILDELD